MTRKSTLPVGWDEARVRDVIDHYDNQTDDEAAAEDDAAYAAPKCVSIDVPVELVAVVRDLIAKHRPNGAR